MISSPICEPLPDGPSLKAYDWRRSYFAAALSRAFTPPPDGEIWEWADANVLLENEDAAEPGEYRSAKTPWTRRLQELFRNPTMWMWNYKLQQWQAVSVHEVSVQKSSQSGFSEACLNGIRWRASFRPCNTIYTLDSEKQAKKIARRLLRSLQHLDPEIFSGDPDDITSLLFKLRGMELSFVGSFSESSFTQVQAPLLICDELEEHGGKNTAENLGSRNKTAKAGLQVNLSKPKLKGGPINVAFTSGNQEEFFVPCPHCQLMQPLTFFAEERDVPFSEEIDEIKDEATGEIVARMPRPLPLGETRKMRTGRIVFDHCRDALGKWDKLSILNDTYYECANPACVATETKGRIYEDRKRWMIDRGDWRPMVFDGTPGIVSQHFNDLYSEDESVKWGKLVLLWLKLKRQGGEGMKTFYNQYLGKVWSEEANKTEASDILANMSGRHLWFVDTTDSEAKPTRHVFSDRSSAERIIAEAAARGIEIPLVESYCPPYRRGHLPWLPHMERGVGTLLLGGDIGGNYARWAVLAAHPNLIDLAVIDWGHEFDVFSLAAMMNSRSWAYSGDNSRHRVLRGFVDSNHRMEDVFKACLPTKRRLIPVIGAGGATGRSVRLWNYTTVPMFRLKRLEINDQRAKSALIIDRIKKKLKRLWFPIDVEEDAEFMEEMCQWEQIEDSKGRWYWPDESGPDHYCDCVKYAVQGFNFLTRAALTGEDSADDEATAE